MDNGPRRLVVSEYLSLDGVMEDPMWTMPYWSDELAAYKRDELFAADALVLGRVTFEAFAEAWASRTSEDGYAERINALPKHVATTTLGPGEVDRRGWNGRHLGDDPKAAVRSLKGGAGGDLLVFGSATLVRSLVRAGLVDEYRLLVYPVVLGQGKRLFESERASLDLVEARSFDTGVTALTYRPSGAGRQNSPL
ncbi:dihydrofolate reductase family protein [Rubrivirga marina]|uniref:Bacterial bifunctional deaminase-reductase C-terminal domain-containing protein n=1 Tax=Rubrivirga marina TaxID=1196024 RepID=A0A271J113_9BACT|nr:dihydrofolate reductase family protein [Rubrivirga marina]PAP77211.1 hypothetical protein BSZ37_12600 [Rubrivirga marina]